MSASKITAKQIVELLRKRHTRDLFFEEVKDGPTWNGAHMRLDAVAIRKSWSPETIYGYEVKVSRGDWLGDRKWEAYMEHAHHFWIAAAPDVVKPEELPAGAGLLVVSSTGASMRTVVKSARRSITPQWPLLLYLLMSRTEPSREWAARNDTRENRIERWRSSIEAGGDIDYHVKGKIRERIDALRDAAGRADELKDLQDWLAVNGGGRWGSLVERVSHAIASREVEIRSAQADLERAAARVADILRGSSALAAETDE